jgi:hypothetical protein
MEREAHKALHMRRNVYFNLERWKIIVSKRKAVNLQFEEKQEPKGIYRRSKSFVALLIDLINYLNF